jgi:Ca-activated chloride channel family protein
MSVDDLHLSVALERTSLVPGERMQTHAVVEINGGAQDEKTWVRPTLTVIFALDVSASMKGPPLQHLAASVERLVGMLTHGDKVGIVTFSAEAAEVMPVSPATAETKKLIQSALYRLEASARTNMEAGLRLAASLMPPRGDNDRQLILLLSDGVPNVGLCTPLTLAEVVRPSRPHVAVWTLGYGPHHQEDILSAISAAGGGRYEYIPQPEVCELAFAKVLGAQGLIVADAMELLLQPEPGVEIKRFVGKHETRFSAEGVVVGLPDLFVAGRRLVVFELALLPPPNARNPWPALTARLKFHSLASREERVMERQLATALSYAPPALADEVYAGVLLARCDEQRAEARALADRGQFEGAGAILKKMIREIEAAPGYVAHDGSSLSEACDHLRDELMVMNAKPKAEEYKAFRRSQISVSVSGHGFSSSTSQVSDPYGQEIMRVVAGDYPVAYLEQMCGVESGRKIQLHAEQVIGRAKTADIRLNSERVSRYHAKIVAQRGSFFVMDLGTADGTMLNDQRVESHLLTSGDLITAADVRFRYTETKEQVEEPRLMALTSDGNIYVVERDRLFVMGSSRACTMVIPSKQVGRQHAAVRYKDGKYWLEDYGSDFGTYRKNGKRLTERVQIRDEDEFMMGDWLVRFVYRT